MAEAAGTRERFDEAPPLRRAAAAAGLATLVAIGRLPFLNTGYGLDPDAWRVAEAARRIADEGRYVASRPPGYPVQEIVSSWVIDAGPLGLCGLTALMSVVASLALGGVVWQTSQARGTRRYAESGLAALAFGYVPIVYINSVVALDYVWAIAFVLLALRASCKGQPIAAGVWIGIAAGCRLTSLLALLPLLMCIEAGLPWRTRLRGAWPKLLGSAGATALVCLTPPLMLRGLHLGKFADGNANPMALPMVETLAALLGPFGAAALVALLITGLLARRIGNSPPAAAGGRGFGRAMLVGALLFTGLFAAYPFELGYLIPAVAFGLLLLTRSLPSPVFCAICATLAISAFVPQLEWNTPPRIGTMETSPFFLVQNARERRVERLTRLAERAALLEAPSVVVAGWLEPQLRVMWADRAPNRPDVEIAYTLDRESLRSYLAAGREVYFVPGQQHYNLKVDNVRLEGSRVRPL